MIKAIIILSALSLVELFAIILLIAMVKLLETELHNMEPLQPIEVDPYDDISLGDIWRENEFLEDE